MNWLPAAALVSPSMKGEVARVISEQADSLVGLARAIHADTEPAFAEFRTSARLVDVLSDSGFEIRIGVGGLSAAFVASRGAGELHVTLCADYGALDARIGHRAGRHLVAGAAVGAALGLAPFVDESGLTVSVVGTPGAGAFDDAHAVLMFVPTASSGGVGQTAARARTDLLLRRALTRNLRALGLQLSPRTWSAEGSDAPSDPRAAYRAMLGEAVALAWTALDAGRDAELRSHLLAAHGVAP